MIAALLTLAPRPPEIDWRQNVAIESHGAADSDIARWRDLGAHIGADEPKPLYTAANNAEIFAAFANGATRVGVAATVVVDPTPWAKLAGFRYAYRTVIPGVPPDVQVHLLEREGRPAVIAWAPNPPAAPVTLGEQSLALTPSPTVFMPERRDPFLDAAVLMPMAPPRFSGIEADFDKLARSMAASVPPGGTLIIQWPTPVLGERRATYRAGEDLEKFVESTRRLPLRTDYEIRVRFTMRLGPGAVQQATIYSHPHPLRIIVTDRRPGEIHVRVVDPAKAFTGTLQALAGAESAHMEIDMTGADNRDYVLKFSASVNTANAIVSLLVKGRAVGMTDK